MNLEYRKQLCQEYLFWERLQVGEQRLWIENSSIEHYEKGNMLYNGEDACKGMFRIISGSCRVYIVSEEGREITLFRLQQGDVCTLSASCILDEIAFDVAIVAEEESEVLVTKSSVLHYLKEQNVYVENYLYKQTVERFSDVMWTMQQVLFQSFDKRLAGFLIDEARASGNPVRMTHDMIASHVVSAREVVSRMLKYFETEQLVRLSRGAVEIIDMEGMKRFLSND